MNSLSRKLLARAEPALWTVFLLSLAIQRRTIVYQATWDFREWLSFFLYGTDILFLMLIVASLIQRPQWWRQKLYRFEYLLLGFVLVSAGSIALSSYQVVSTLAFARLVEFVIFYWYVSRYALVHFNRIYSAMVLVAGILVQAILAIGQFMVQHDLGLRVLGESVLAPTMQGVASFFLASGEKVIRAYGTTPHPNVLAAYVLVGLVAVCVLVIRYGTTPRRKNIFLFCYGILLWGFTLTFSRTLIAVWVLIMMIGGVMVWRHRDTRKALLVILYTTVIYGALLTIGYWPEVVSRVTISGQEEAVQLRLYYNGQALSSGGRVLNWFGVGIGNFVGWLMQYQPGLARYLYQPVHNIYLLVYSEVGIVGIVFLIGFLGGLKIAFLKQHFTSIVPWAAFLVWGAILAAGLLDHFPWTLQQGRFLLWGTTGIIAFCVGRRDELV